MADGEGAGRDLPRQSTALYTVRERLSALRAGTEALVPRLIDLAALERDSAAARLHDLTDHLLAVEDELDDLVLASGDFDDVRVPPVRVLFDDAPLPYLVTDTHGVILVANRAAGMLLTRRTEELPGVPLGGFAGPPPGMLRRVVTAAAASAVPRSASLSLRSPRRSPRQVRVTVQRLATGPTGPVLLWQLHPSVTADPVPPARHAAPAGAAPIDNRAVPGGYDAAPVRPAEAPVAEHPDAVLALASAPIAELDLRDALTRLATAAARGVTAAEGASVTLLDPPSSGASDERVEHADRVQFDEQSGPGVAAVAEVRTVVAGDLATDPRWAAGGPRVAVESGFRAVLAVPLVGGGTVLGALTLYAATPGRFGAGAVADAELLAAPVAARVMDVRAYRASLHVADELRHGLVSRAVIDQAKGILMVQHGLTADQAFAVLTRFSQQENRKLREVAADLVDSSVRESRSRQGNAPNG
jgi:GAF domain-containing protein